MTDSGPDNSTNREKPAVRVSVGILINDRNEVMLCRRAEHKSYPLKWEFPGGKVEAGEDGTDALKRELREELAIRVEEHRLFFRERNDYSDGRTYEVEYFEVRSWSGEIVNREFAGIAWVAPEALNEFDILEGNVNVCRRLAETLPADSRSN